MKICAFVIVAPYVVSLLFLDVPFGKDEILFSGSSVLFASGLLIGDTFRPPGRAYDGFVVGCAFTVFLATPFLSRLRLFLVPVTIAFVYVCANSNCTAFKWLTGLGDASYSVYLVHAIVLSVLKNVTTNRSLLFFALFVGVSLLAGMFYYVYVERPLVRLANRVLAVRRPESGSQRLASDVENR